MEFYKQPFISNAKAFQLELNLHIDWAILKQTYDFIQAIL